MKLAEEIIEKAKNNETIDNSNLLEMLLYMNIQIVLKKYYLIINKLKIEVEELENKNRDLQIFVDDVKEGVYIDTPEFEETYINRNKIKEKLDRAKEVLDYMDNEKDRTIQIIIINYLQELWEGE